jgi:hypothetical protein
MALKNAPQSCIRAASFCEHHNSARFNIKSMHNAWSLGGTDIPHLRARLG